jgi:glutamate racemase
MFLRLLLIPLWFCWTNAPHVLPDPAQELNTMQWTTKDSVTILVTDSGLGGLSVCAEIDRRLRNEHVFRNVRIVFFNALPDAGRGYNKMSGMDEKARVFQAALEGMVQSYHPDVILIACNTLSVVYPFTPFSQHPSVPVLGIVELGAKLLQAELVRDTSAVCIVFGTETTIAGGNHKRLLMAGGIAGDRVIEQSCPGLAGEIESDARGPKVKAMVEGFTSSALKHVPAGTRHVVAGLCCTHYGYCAGAFAAGLGDGAKIVDPNAALAGEVFVQGRRFPGTHVAVNVASRAEIFPEEIRSIGSLLETVSPATATALRSYEHRLELFAP